MSVVIVITADGLQISEKGEMIFGGVLVRQSQVELLSHG